MALTTLISTISDPPLEEESAQKSEETPLARECAFMRARCYNVNSQR